MNSRNRSLLSSFLFTLVIAGATIYFLALKKQLDDRSKPAFEPIHVLKLTWTTNKRSFVFERTPDRSAWHPPIDSDRIDSKLRDLAILPLLAMVPNADDETPVIFIKLKMLDSGEWSGLYQNNKFFWVGGPRQGLGTVLSSAQAEIFKEGRFAFDPLIWNWCLSPIKKIIFEKGVDVVELSRKSEFWEVANVSNQSQIVKNKWVDDWVSLSCPSHLRAWVDLEYEDFGNEDGNFEVEYENGPGLQASIRTPNFKLTDDKAAISPELIENLIKILNLF